MKLNNHKPYLDGVRGLSALYVVMHHAMLQVYAPDGRYRGLPGIFCSLLSLGHYAVTLFITLSGLCLMLQVIQRQPDLSVNSKDFLVRRATRIIPTYYFSLALSLILIFTLVGQKTGTHWDTSLPVTWTSVVVHLLLLQNFIGRAESNINHAMWSISLEWWIYFLFPVIVYLWQKHGAIKATIISTLVSFALVCASRLIRHQFNLQYIACFALGMLAAGIAYQESEPMAKLRSLPWAIIAVVIFALWFPIAVTHRMMFTLSDTLFITLSDTTFAMFCLCFLIATAKNPQNGVASILGSRPLVWIGTISYSLYLIHAPLLQVEQQYVFGSLGFHSLKMLLALLIIGVPAIVIVSAAFNHYFERPFSRHKLIQAKVPSFTPSV